MIKEYILTETDIQEALEFLDLISSQQIQESTEFDSWRSETFMIIMPLDGEEFILL